MILTEENIEAELSYAYLHAVAARAGISCESTNRHRDSAGIDAVLAVRDRFSADSVLTEFTVEVQLKATARTPVEQNGTYSFSIKVDLYNKLRRTDVGAPRLLVVLFLPGDKQEWLRVTEDQLVAKRCAYWVSLRNAPESENDKTQTVYIPRANVLDMEALRSLMARFSRREEIDYAV